MFLKKWLILLKMEKLLILWQVIDCSSDWTESACIRPESDVPEVYRRLWSDSDWDWSHITRTRDLVFAEQPQLRPPSYLLLLTTHSKLSLISPVKAQSNGDNVWCKRNNRGRPRTCTRDQNTPRHTVLRYLRQPGAPVTISPHRVLRYEAGRMDRVAWAGRLGSRRPSPGAGDVGINPGLGELDPKQLRIA